MASPDFQSPSPDHSTINLSSGELRKLGEGCNRPAAERSKRGGASSTSLSSQSSKGGSETRVRKRKVRSGRDGGDRVDVKAMPPIRRLFADKSDFKEIVHQFTGNPLPPPMPKLPFVGAESQSEQALLLAAAIKQSLSTLDIISSYLLLQGSSQESYKMLSEINRRKSIALLQVLMHAHLQGFCSISEMGTNKFSSLGVINNSSSLSPSLYGGGGTTLDSLSPSLDLSHLFASQQEVTPHSSLDMSNIQQPSHQSHQVAQLESCSRGMRRQTISFP